MCRGRRGRATVQTPCGVEIGGQKLDRSTQDDGTAPHYCHRRNNFSPNVEAFSRDAVSLARLRHQHRRHGLNVWMIHGRMIVGHSRHAVGRLTAVALTFHSCVAFAYECADPARSNPGEQDRQQNYRSCGSSRHFGNCTLESMRCANLLKEPSSTGVFLTRTQMKGHSREVNSTASCLRSHRKGFKMRTVRFRPHCPHRRGRTHLKMKT